MRLARLAGGLSRNLDDEPRDVGQNEIGGLGSQFNRKYIAMIAMTSMTARGVGPRPVLATRYEDSNGIGDRAIPPLTHVLAPSGRHIRTLRAKMVAPVRAVSESKVSQEALVTSLPLSMATMLLSCAPSYAEEAVAEATKEAADIMSENSGVLGYTNGGLVVAFSPLVIYGGEYQRVSKSIEEQVAPRLDAHPLARPPACSPVFYLYRATINPKAKVQDLLFVAAFCVVAANILSITVFHRRIY